MYKDNRSDLSAAGTATSPLISSTSNQCIATQPDDDKARRTHRYCREIIMSPFWLRTIIMEIMAAVGLSGAQGRELLLCVQPRRGDQKRKGRRGAARVAAEACRRVANDSANTGNPKPKFTSRVSLEYTLGCKEYIDFPDDVRRRAHLYRGDKSTELLQQPPVTPLPSRRHRSHPIKNDNATTTQG
jgi:hypothetical protein